ncbi:AAA family ATPase [Schlesneria sp.]|uniref:AAA family ATPase n=1 Tax=Schlesneria sp. TaxID=2762018 RepID=UPI002EF6BE2D
MAGDDSIRGLREALAQTPDNVPLRKLLAETLLGFGRADEAEQEFREALSRDRNNAELKLGLARAFEQQGKSSHAIVIVEQLIKERDTPAAAYLLHSRLLFQQGDIEFAVTEYRRAVSEDESLRDPVFAAELGVDADEKSDVVEGKVRAAWNGEDDSSSPSLSSVERPKINFGSVGGMDALKEEIRMKIIYPLQHREMFAAYGKTIGGGILMYGPPGCGKTHLARATAGEINAEFICIGINDVLDMWIGNSEKKLHELFDYARSHQPCVLFFDEVDALGASRTDMKTSASRHLVNQFLAELDGAKSSNEGVLILAATNAPWHLDPAFRRPGRFDRILFVPPPDEPARADILRLHLTGKPVETIDHGQVARKTKDFSGADMKAIVDQTVEAKLREAMKTMRPIPITTGDLVSAAASLKPSTKEWFTSARNYALYSNQGGLYDDILKYLKLK